jgi:HK97 gp10 family phage protein
MARVSLRWHRLAELRRDLATMAKDMTNAARPIVSVSAEDAADLMRARYPLGATGRLRDSVVVHENTQKRTATHVSWQVTNTAPYAHFVEFGTRYMGARPVFVPTRNQQRRRMGDELTALLPSFNCKARGGFDS